MVISFEPLGDSQTFGWFSALSIQIHQCHSISSILNLILAQNSSLNLFDFLMSHFLGSNEYRAVIPFTKGRKTLCITKGSLQEGPGSPIKSSFLLECCVCENHFLFGKGQHLIRKSDVEMIDKWFLYLKSYIHTGRRRQEIFAFAFVKCKCIPEYRLHCYRNPESTHAYRQNDHSTMVPDKHLMKKSKS